MAFTNRSHTAKDEEISLFGGALIHHWRKPAPGDSLAMVVHLEPKFNAHLPPRKNPANPPYHFHYKQREDFKVEQGSVIFTIEGKDVVKTKEDGIIIIHPGMYHTFRVDPNSKEDALLLITAEADDNGLTERFFRNLFGYLKDCELRKQAPNVFQMFLFFHSAGMSVVLPGPKFIAQPLSRFVTYLIGPVIGKAVFGFKENYEEYYNPANTK